MKTDQASAACGAVRFRPHRGLAGITFMLMILSVCLSACTSIRPVADDAETLQQRIRAAQVVRKGDHVRVVTHDGVSRRLTVVSVESDVLKGRLDTKAPTATRSDEPGAQMPEEQKGALVGIPISDIVFVEEEKLSAGKTVAAIGGGTVVFVSVLLLIAVLAW